MKAYIKTKVKIILLPVLLRWNTKKRWDCYVYSRDEAEPVKRDTFPIQACSECAFVCLYSERVGQTSAMMLKKKDQMTEAAQERTQLNLVGINLDQSIKLPLSRILSAYFYAEGCRRKYAFTGLYPLGKRKA